MATAKTDAELIRAARTDPAAFAELYRRHAGTIDRYLRSRADSGAASELVAETFAQAALSLRRFRDERQGSALPWLYGIAANLVRTYHERNASNGEPANVSASRCARTSSTWKRATNASRPSGSPPSSPRLYASCRILSDGRSRSAWSTAFRSRRSPSLSTVPRSPPASVSAARSGHSHDG